jgi:hypothetical protein
MWYLSRYQFSQSDLKHLFLSRQDCLVIQNLEFAFAGWKVIAVLNMYQNPPLTFVAKLILLEWPIVCLQEVREFSLSDIIVKSVFMLSRSPKCSHDLKV